MALTLPKLPYEESALEPHVDATTMNIHHTKHHQTYITNVNNIVAQHEDLKGLDVLGLLEKVGTDAPGANVAFRNNIGGCWNHQFFWKVMCNPSNTSGAMGDLKSAIETSFGSVEAMKDQFTAAATTRFGSGWAWLGLKADGKLAITSTPNQDNPLMKIDGVDSMIPVLGLDVWEHAYYLKYQNRRPEYIKEWWNVVNWEQVSVNLKDASAGKIPL